MAARLLLALVLPLVSVSLAPGGVLLRRARLTDSWGMAKVCCDSFYPENAKINGVDARIPWAAALLRRLVAIKRGSLSPHGVFVAVEGDVVVGCVEIGLLPAPPGCVVAPEATAEASEAAALWRGVAVENRAAWRPPEGDCATLANVAVAPGFRKRSVGRLLVDAAAEALKTDDLWVDWRRRASADEDHVYARVTDDAAVAFWRRVGFEDVPTAAGATDARGKGGLWLRRDLAPGGGAAT